MYLFLWYVATRSFHSSFLLDIMRFTHSLQRLSVGALTSTGSSGITLTSSHVLVDLERVGQVSLVELSLLEDDD